MILLEMIADKDNYLNIIKKKWLTARDTFPDFFSDITPETRVINDQYVEEITAKLHKQIKSFHRFPFRHKKWKQETLRLIKYILYEESIIGLHNYMDPPVIDVFEEEVFTFLRHVRSFAPELTFCDIGQAIRNYIVYAMFKKIHNVKTGFSKSGFGYSMLYPFTDNYIDDKKCTPTEKKEYNQLIRNKIKGNPTSPTTKHQIKTCELLQAIETEYPSHNNTGIQQLLLMMLEAQENSIRQQNRGLPLTSEERLNISVDKGGISVLIDRFFVNKEITEKDFLFYLAFGYFLQLADDIQDIKEDSEQGHSTLFTLNLQWEYEEKLVNKLLHFLQEIMEEYQADNESFKNFIFYSSQLLILSSTISSKEFFSPVYVKNLERCLPVSFHIIENYLNNKMDCMDLSLQKKYLKIIDVLIKP